MRLLKPSLYSNLPYHLSGENESNVVNKVLLDKVYNAQDFYEMNAQSNFSSSDLLILPQSFGLV